MSPFAALDEPFKAVARFPIEPRDKSPASEAARQAAFRTMLRFAGPSIESWSVPNAAKRGPKAQRQAKLEGMKAGVADEHYAWNHGIAFLEWKNGTDAPDQNQIEWCNRMLDRGFRVACVRTPEFALRLFAEWGAPVRLRQTA